MFECMTEKGKRFKRTLAISTRNGNKPTDLKGQLEQVVKGCNLVRRALARFWGLSKREVLYPSQSLQSTSILTLQQGQNTALHSDCWMKKRIQSSTIFHSLVETHDRTMCKHWMVSTAMFDHARSHAYLGPGSALSVQPTLTSPLFNKNLSTYCLRS